MKLYSTNNKTAFVDLKEAVLKGLPDDNGLFMPEHIPSLPQDFIKNIKDYSFPELAYIMAKTFLQGAIPEKDLKLIIDTAINFTPVSSCQSS